MDIISRALAKSMGLTRYFTGKLCKHEHLAERFVSSRGCVECVSNLAKNFAAKNADAIRNSKAIYQQKYRKKHQQKARISRQLWAEKNRNKDQAYKKEWRLRNKGKVNSLTRKRQLAQLKRTPKWLTDDDFWLIEQAYELAALRTKMLGFAWHVDHVIPLQGKTVSGLHVPTNLQVIPGVENIRKGNKVRDHGWPKVCVR